MTDNRDRAGLLGRTWRSLLESSQVAVAIHYDAPWQHTCKLPERVSGDAVPISALAGA